MKALRKRTLMFYLLVFVGIVVASFLVLESIEEDRAFQFNPESSYWPTDGWLSTTPEAQGIDSMALIQLFDAIKKPTLSRRIRDLVVEKLFHVPTFDVFDIDGVLIARNGFIVSEAYSSDSGKDELNLILGSTASVTSALMGIALDKDYIPDLDQSVLQFFPHHSPRNMDARKRSLTIRHLLTMTCGFDWPETAVDYSNQENPYNQMFYSDNWAEFVLDRPMAEQPGTRFNFNSGCAQLLVSIVHRATGGDALGFAQRSLFTPLGITNFEWGTADVSVDPNEKDVVNGAGGLAMRVRDMARFGYLYLKGGHWDGQQLISQSWVETSTRRQADITGLMGWYLDDYGYQWYVDSFGFYSLGFKGQYIFVIPELDIVAVFVGDLQPYQTFDPVSLVEDFILPSVKSDQALADNPQAVALLRQRESEL